VFKANSRAAPTTRKDKWILHMLSLCVRDCNEAFRSYSFFTLTTALYDFWYYSLADVYVEAVKPLFREDGNLNRAAQLDCMNTFYCCLDTALRLLHPLMPFITEELWQHLQGHPDNRPESICIAPYPLETEPFFDALLKDMMVEDEFKLVNDATKAFRNLINPVLIKSGGQAAKKAKTFVVVDDSAFSGFDDEALSDLGVLCKVEAKPVLVAAKDFHGEGMVEVVRPGVKLVVIVEGAVDVEAELQKLSKKQEGLRKDFDDLSAKIANSSYAQRAKPEIIAKDKQRLDDLTRSLCTVEEEIVKLSSK